MCGIFGQVNERGANPTLVERMAQRTAHRGPDGYGIWQDGRVALGAGRLAIIDLSAGVQPVFSEDRQTVVAFNGEIYNHRVLRAELEREGHHFYTQTDTEVIVHGYEQWGVGCIARLEGMFGVANFLLRICIKTMPASPKLKHYTITWNLHLNTNG